MATRSIPKLFVYNLPWTVNNLKLRTHFSKFGQIAASNVVFDKNTGLSRGYGFVLFNNQIGFEAAKSSPHVIDGSNVRLQTAQ